MKRVITFVASMLMVLAVNAQIDVNSIKTFSSTLRYAIPAQFTYDGETKLVIGEYTTVVVDGVTTSKLTKLFLYDSDLNETQLDFPSTSSVTSLNWQDFENFSNGVNMYATQTLFNDDADYEFFEFLGEQPKSTWDSSTGKQVYTGGWTGFKIYTDTKNIQEVTFENGLKMAGSSASVLGFGGKYYLIFNGMDTESHSQNLLYLIDKSKPAGIKQLKNVKKPLADILNNQAKIYDAEGRQHSNTVSGMNIIKAADGTTTKVMMK